MSRTAMILIEQARKDGLSELKLSDHSITELPAEIGELTSLQSLTVDSRRLSKIPAELWGLTKLETLVLGSSVGPDSPLASLPPGISRLRNLRTLHLGGNRLRELPPDIVLLKELKDLRIGHNGLRRIPPEVFQLTGLQVLYLRHNQIHELPADIGQLVELSRLDISQNRLTSLPFELGLLTNLVNLDLEENPLDDPIMTLASRGADAVLSYLRDMWEDGIPLYEAKVLLVGEGEVGKTSLVHALDGSPFEESRPTTHGIELAILSVGHPELDVKILLNTWDFGGQEVYRITHQFFFSPRALYLLVWKPRQGQHENSIDFWLRLIQLRVGPGVRVIIVATHGDERRPELDVAYLQQRFGPMVVGQWVVDNRSGGGIPELRKAIAEQAARLPQVGKAMSKRWISVRDELMAIDQPQILYKLYEEISNRHELDQLARRSLAELMHDLGYIVYFGDDDGLRDVMVLQPEWLTKAIGYILEDEEVRARGGELDHSRLASIWQPEDKEAYSSVYHPYFLRLMEKFDVSYRIPETEKSLVAQLVPYERPSLQWPEDAGDLGELSLICDLSDEAPGLMAWLTVRNYRFSTGKHWRRGVLLEYPEYSSSALLELSALRELRLVVRAPSPVYMFSILRDTVEDLIRRRWPGLRYDLFVPCPIRPEDGQLCHGRFKLNTLERVLAKRRPTVLCEECFEDVDVARLLTGFSVVPGPVAPLLDNRSAQLDRIEDGLSRVGDRVGGIEAFAADVAFDIRIVRKAISMEVTDCPRLFSLEPVRHRGWSPARLWRNRYLLSLWCEHPGYEHRCEHPGYDFEETREWLERAAPYIGTLSKVLRLLPVASAAAGLLAVDADKPDLLELKRVKAEIDLMNTIANQMGQPPGGYVDPGRGLAPAESSGLRAFRELLFRLDAAKSFAGLVRVVTESGDYLWVCLDHHGIYDPGLPELVDASQPRGSDATTGQLPSI